MSIFTDNASTFLLWEIFGPKREEVTKNSSVFFSYKLFPVRIFVRQALIKFPIRRYQYNLLEAEGGKPQSGPRDGHKIGMCVTRSVLETQLLLG